MYKLPNIPTENWEDGSCWNDCGSSQVVWVTICRAPRTGGPIPYLEYFLVVKVVWSQCKCRMCWKMFAVRKARTHMIYSSWLHYCCTQSLCRKRSSVFLHKHKTRSWDSCIARARTPWLWRKWLSANIQNTDRGAYNILYKCMIYIYIHTHTMCFCPGGCFRQQFAKTKLASTECFTFVLSVYIYYVHHMISHYIYMHIIYR